MTRKKFGGDRHHHPSDRFLEVARVIPRGLAVQSRNFQPLVIGLMEADRPSWEQRGQVPIDQPDTNPEAWRCEAAFPSETFANLAIVSPYGRSDDRPSYLKPNNL